MDIAKNDDILEKSGYLLLDRATLIENYRKLQRHVGPEVTLIPVVKGNCYGYGAEEITDVLVNDCRVRVIGVGALCEGTAMRRRGVACDLMLLGGIAPQQYDIALHNDIIISIFRPECALAYEELCAAEGRVGRIQIKIETGMNRLGVRPGEDLAVLLTTLAACPHLSVCGVYSHFATATNCVNDAFTIEQHDRFMQGLRQIEAAGIRAQYVHCCNSAAVTWFEEAFHNSVRVGGILYGHLVMEDGVEPVDIQEIITLRAYITNLHTMPAGESIGYPQKFRSGTGLQLATLSVGFADGIPVDYARGQGPILVHGRRTRFLELCMDQSIIDVTGIPCKVGDEVTLIGQDGDERISVYSIEKRTGRTFDALLTFISDRIARICR